MKLDNFYRSMSQVMSNNIPQYVRGKEEEKKEHIYTEEELEK